MTTAKDWIVSSLEHLRRAKDEAMTRSVPSSVGQRIFNNITDAQGELFELARVLGIELEKEDENGMAR